MILELHELFLLFLVVLLICDIINNCHISLYILESLSNSNKVQFLAFFFFLIESAMKADHRLALSLTTSWRRLSSTSSFSCRRHLDGDSVSSPSMVNARFLLTPP